MAEKDNVHTNGDRSFDGLSADDLSLLNVVSQVIDAEEHYAQPGDSSINDMCVELLSIADRPTDIFRRDLLQHLQTELFSTVSLDATATPGPLAGTSAFTRSDKHNSAHPTLVDSQTAHPKRAVQPWWHPRSSSRLARVTLGLAGLAAMLVLLLGMWVVVKMRKDVTTQAQQTPTTVVVSGVQASSTVTGTMGTTIVPIISPSNVANSLDVVPNLTLRLTLNTGDIPADQQEGPLMAWSPDGSTVAAAGSNVVSVWDAYTGNNLYVSSFSESAASPAYALAWSPDGSMLAVGTGFDTVVLFDSHTGKELERLISPAPDDFKGTPIVPANMPVRSLAWSPDGHTLVSAPDFRWPLYPASHAGVIHLWNVSTGKLSSNLVLPAREELKMWDEGPSVAKVVWSPGGSTLASLSDDGQLVLWNLTSGKHTTLVDPAALAGNQQEQPTDIRWSPDGRTLAVVTNYAVQLWDPSTAKIVRTLPDPPVPHRIPGALPTDVPGAAIPTATATYVYDEANFGVISSAQWSPQGNLIATTDGPQPASIRMWDVATGRLQQSVALSQPNYGTFTDRWAPDGHVLTYLDGGLKFWNVAGNSLIRELSADNPSGFSWSPDGTMLAVHKHGHIEIWNGGAVPTVQTPSASGTSSTPTIVSQSNPPGSVCGSWEIMPSESQGNVSELRAVSALSDNDVWAVGSFSSAIPAQVVGPVLGPAGSLVMHWNGQGWSMMSPNVGKGNNRLFGVAALASNDVWAVGYYDSNTTGRDYGSQDAGAGPTHAVVWHITGKVYQDEAVLPDFGSQSSRLLSISASSPTDIWAAGYLGGDTTGGVQGAATALILHYDGKAWSQMVAPGSADYNYQLNSISALGPNAAWAVGRMYAGANLWVPGLTGGPMGDPGEPLILLWDGKNWNRVPAPPTGNSLNGVTVLSPDVAWAVGENAGEGNSNSIALRWDGKNWSISDLHAPEPGFKDAPHLDNLTSVAALSPNDAWAVGSYNPQLPTQTQAQVRTMALHWDGVAWSFIPTPYRETTAQYQDGINSLYGVSASPSGQVWAVGSFSTGTTSSQTLVLRYRPAACSTATAGSTPANPSTTAAPPTSPTPTAPNAQAQTPTSAANVGGECGPTWAALDVPAAGNFNAISAVSPNDIWAVGSNTNVPVDTLAAHWDGTGWTVVPSPNVGTNDNILYGVSSVRSGAPSSAGSGQAVWGVGSYGTGSTGSKPLIIRWDGSAWKVIPSPDPGPGRGVLHAVFALTPNDAWAVGSYATSDALGNAIAGQSWTLIEHWDGTRWSTVPSPSPGNAINNLSAIAAVTDNDIWAVGSYEQQQTEPIGAGKTLILHWDGSAWTEVPSPNAQTWISGLSGVAARSVDDVWAVGGVNGGEHVDPLTMHWDGKQWSIISSPVSTSHNGGSLSSVAVLSGNNVWAVGGDSMTPLLTHWDGKEWSNVTSPIGGVAGNSLPIGTLLGLTVLSPNNMIAVGGLAVGYIGGTSSIPIAARYGTLPCSSLTPLPAATRTLSPLPTARALSTSRALPTTTSTPLVKYGSVCGMWTAYDSTNGLSGISIGTDGTLFRGVAALSSQDIWAVGNTRQDALLAHWDGKAWSRVEAPTVGSWPGYGASLEAITALASDDIWAVGSYSGQYAGQEGLPLTMHWDGKQWSIFAAPNKPGLNYYLNGVAGSGPNDVWVVGETISDLSVEHVQAGMIFFHWDGTRWAEVPGPDVGDGHTILNAVAARAGHGDDVWAVGVRAITQSTTTPNSPVEYRALALHWDGKAWSNTNTDLGGFRDVAIISASDAWAVGNGLVEHWDGVAWSKVTTPNLGERGSIDRMAVFGTKVWGLSTSDATLISEWDGRQWSAIPGPPLSVTSTNLHAITAASDGEIWVAGEAHYLPWLARFDVGPCPAQGR